MSSIKISVVIPIFNEQENIQELLSRLVNVLKPIYDYEIILIDDGSRDQSSVMIAKACLENKNIKLISFSRNFGHQIAISAGLRYAAGDAVIVMDGDLQDPPEVLPMFIDKWKEGYEVVYAIRQKRKENVIKKFCYYLFYRLMSYLAPFDIPLDSGDFSIVDRKIVAILNSLPERNKFIRGLRAWSGFNQIGLEYERAARFKGKPKFTFKKLFKLAYDGLISFSDVPLKFASSLGLILVIVSFVAILYVAFVKIFIKQNIIEGWASTTIIVLLIGGIQFLLFGIFGEYISRIFDEVKQRPEFIVKNKINLE